ncbi:hypothetical protein CATRI_13385 (plasmid) [Corynebacterium atrinae]|nr:hypothetical protein CATRI_13385 [Corynebacterium atrinae]
MIPRAPPTMSSDSFREQDVPLPGFDFLQPAVVAPVRRSVASSPTLTATAADIRRFWRRVVVSPSCWFWIGAVSVPDGYGRFTWQRGGVQRTLAAHRFSLMISGQEIDGQVAEHHCNEPLCVRVGDRHVFASTQAANVAWAVQLGRHRGNVRTVGEGQEPAARSHRIREALEHGWNESAYLRAVAEGDVSQTSLLLPGETSSSPSPQWLGLPGAPGRRQRS